MVINLGGKTEKANSVQEELKCHTQQGMGRDYVVLYGDTVIARRYGQRWERKSSCLLLLKENHQLTQLRGRYGENQWTRRSVTMAKKQDDLGV